MLFRTVCIAALAFVCAKGSASMRAVEGVLDLRAGVFDERRTLKLDGDWAFVWDTLMDPLASDALFTERVRVPGHWGARAEDRGIFHQAFGAATFRLRVLLPSDAPPLALKLPNIHTAYRLFVNGEEIAACGTMGDSRHASIPSSRTRIVPFPVGADGVAVITIQITNHHFPNASGLWAPLEVGTVPAVAASRGRGFLQHGLLLGSLLVMGLYHIGLYVLRRRNKGALYFAMACFLLAYRELFAGEIIAFELLPGMEWNVAMRSLILVFPASMLAITLFIRDLYPTCFSIVFMRVVAVVSALFATLVLLAPPQVYLVVMLPFNLFAFAAGVYSVIALVRAVRKRLSGARLFLVGILLLVFTVANDTLVQMGLLQGYFLIPAGFFCFILAQSLVLAVRFVRSFFRVEELTEHLERTNIAYERFVPKEMLRLLDRGDITKVGLGDEREGEMTVLFADIVGFSTVAEGMSANETFRLINWTLGRTSGVIRKHGGFIDKYIGDAIMAIFPTDPASAVRAALEMRDMLSEGMKEEPFGPGVRVDYGIGIHIGNMILGTVGDADRMEGTVISDAVNIAARVEGLTRRYKEGIVITEDVVRRIADSPDLVLRFLDETPVKGRSAPVKVYGVAWA